MLATVGKALGSVLRSMFISIVMLLIALSVISGQFPPDLDRLQKTYSSLQEMTKLSHEVQEQKKATTVDQPGADFMEEADLRKLEALNTKRAELGANLLPSGPDVPAVTKTAFEPKTQEQLENKIRDLQQDLFRLQERVNRLETQTKGETP